MASFNPRKIPKYRAKIDPVKAADLNDIVARLERIERITVGAPLQLLSNSRALAIGFDTSALRKLDFYRFVQFTESSIDPVDELFYCRQFKRNNDRSLALFGKKFQFGNFFKYCADFEAYGLVIKWPNGNAEWTLIQTWCPEDVCNSSGL